MREANIKHRAEKCTRSFLLAVHCERLHRRSVYYRHWSERECVTQPFFIRLSQACIAFKQMTLSGSRFGARARLQKRESSGCSKRIYRFTLQNTLNGIILKITQSECDGSDTPFSQALSFLPRFCTADKHQV